MPYSRRALVLVEFSFATFSRPEYSFATSSRIGAIICRAHTIPPSNPRALGWNLQDLGIERVVGYVVDMLSHVCPWDLEWPPRMWGTWDRVYRN